MATTETTRTETERAIRERLDAGEHDAALTLALRAYGPELLGFLYMRLGDTESAREAFAWLSEGLWRGLPGFRAESSVRAWAYAIARNVAARYVDRELRLVHAAVPLSQLSRESALAVVMPASTSLDARVERLRAQLSDEERTLLTLRVDKHLDFREVALVMLYDGEHLPDEDALVREATRLRKRFQLVKDKLRKLAAGE
jgi:RNA polymerase sigma-70 factor (ECF subfamily)